MPDFKGSNKWTGSKSIHDVKEVITSTVNRRARKASKDIDNDIKQIKKIEDTAITLIVEGSN